MRLRSWQVDCIESAQTNFASGQKSFLALATPGAGKTIMAANLAKRLLDNELIDYVICFAPSKAVTSSIAKTFCNVLGKGMNGHIGDIGATYTYQYLAMNRTNEWKLISNYRVLIVFDEIHHAGGDIEGLANSWGREILKKLKNNAAFILSMTGTPWRTDSAPITLARYIEPDWRVDCDYTYGLAQAVLDGVCRLPELRLFDNNCLRVNNEDYSSISAALENSNMRYADLLDNSDALNYMLSQAVRKLASIRLSHSDAGGVLIAKSVEHAHRIFQILTQDYQQSAVLVSYQELEPESIINRFRKGNTQWIVSISMVSEGTDIPRLRLCVHLSTIRTELFFRQVLGRVLRVMPSTENKKGWLYTFAEPQLTSYAERIQEDLPTHKCKFVSIMDASPEVNAEPRSPDNSTVNINLDEKNIDFNPSDQDSSITEAHKFKPLLFRLNGQFRHEIFSIFQN